MSFPCSQSLSWLETLHACMQTDRQAGRQADTEVLFWQPAPINNQAVILLVLSVENAGGEM